MGGKLRAHAPGVGASRETAARLLRGYRADCLAHGDVRQAQAALELSIARALDRAAAGRDNGR